jgi:hypothetical protein
MRLVRIALVAALAMALTLAGNAAGAQVPPVLEPPIQEIVAPLSGTPTIQLRTDPLVVELDPGRDVDLDSITAGLRPSFGIDRSTIPLESPSSIEADAASELWPGRIVDRVTFDLPDHPWLIEDLYDIELDWSGGDDVERRAVKIVDEHAATPRIVVIADPSVWDPRPVQEGAQEALDGDPDSLFEKLTGTFGDLVNQPRWAALNRAIDEINLVQPDLVLVAGDLTFIAHPTTAPLEYADAYEILDRLEVPSFVTPGNHDLYALDDYTEIDQLELIDGWAAWQDWFGPLYWSTDLGPNFHLVSINTFDWQNRAPFPPPDFPTLAGGTISDDQWAWLVDDLLGQRARNPDGHLVTLAHHDPSMFGNRHNWPGAYRYETRDLFAEARVDAHFSGHTHEDRVARYFEGGTVQTNGRPHMGHPLGVLSLALRNDDQIDTVLGQDELGAIIHEPSHGPLFVSTTTAASGLVGEDWGLGGYWGWRLATLERRPDGGYDPVSFGYPATPEFLAERAAVPGNWNADHAEYGVFSYPSYDLDLVGLGGGDGTADFATAKLDSRLLTDVEVTLRLVVAGVAPSRLVSAGGTILRTRTVGETTTAWVRAVVDAGSQQLVEVREGTPASGGDDGQPEQPTGQDTTPITGAGQLGQVFGLTMLVIAAATRRRLPAG